MGRQDFVPYPIAVRMKDCGFDDPCYSRWALEPDGKPMLVGSTAFVFRNSECKGRDAAAPLLSQAHRWLREKKGIELHVVPRWINAYEVVGLILGESAIGTKYIFDLWNNKKPYLSYEAALSAGIYAALELWNAK